MMTTTIADRLTDDLKHAMRTGDTQRRDVIRFLRSALKNAEIEKRSALVDADVVEVIQAQIKQRRDSIDAFEQAGRQDLAARESAELAVLEEYLPADQKPLDETELHSIVSETIAELGLSGPGDMRVLMPALIERTAGRADNRLLSKIASTELQQVKPNR
jgi:uncharacterized protein YqeY